MERLTSEHATIMADANEHRENFEYFMLRIDKAIEIADKMAKLDSEYKRFLLKELNEGSLEILQQFINKLFGVGA